LEFSSELNDNDNDIDKCIKNIINKVESQDNITKDQLFIEKICSYKDFIKNLNIY
jgi:hypothetical protein